MLIVFPSTLVAETKILYGYNFRRSHPEVFLQESFLKICRKFTGQDPCQSVISIK